MTKIKTPFLITLLLLFISIHSFSQTKEIDSLKNDLLGHHKTDTTKVNLLYKVAFAYFQIGSRKSENYLNQTEKLADSLNYTLGKAKVAYLNGIFESQKSNHKQGLAYFNKSMKLYQSINDTEGIAAVHSAFGIVHYMRSEYPEALNQHKLASEYYEKSGNNNAQFSSLQNVANVYADLGKYDEALINYNKVLTFEKKKNNDRQISNLLHSIGHIHKLQGNYPIAIENFNKAIDITTKIADTFSLAVKLNSLGDTYNTLKKHDKALSYHEKSLRFAKLKDAKNLVAINHNNIGNIYLNKNDYEKALHYYHLSLATSIEIHDLTQASSCYNNIGTVNLKLGNIKTSRENFLKCKEISESINSQRSLSISLISIAETYFIENNYNEALKLILQSQEIANELKLFQVQKKALEMLSEIYSEQGDFKNAFSSHRKYKLLSDSLFNKESLEKITQVEYEYKYKQKLDSASIRELKLTKIVYDTSKNLETSQRKYLWAIITILIVTIIAVSIIFGMKIRNLNAKSKHISMEQKLLRSQMTPHFIFNSLSVLQGMILNKESEKSVSYLSKFSKLLRITLENSRDKAVPLKEELIAVENYLALQNLEQDKYVYYIDIDDKIDATNFNIPPMLIQPFIENSIEHAFQNHIGEKKIEIKMEFKEKILTCYILDNGIGIHSQEKELNENKKSLATKITNERLNMLSKQLKMKGSIQVEDRKKFGEQGTKVTLVIPYTSKG